MSVEEKRSWLVKKINAFRRTDATTEPVESAIDALIAEVRAEHAPVDGEEVLRFSGECIKALSVAHRPGVQDGDYSLYAPGLKDGESYTVVVTRNAKPEPMTEEPKSTLADMEKLKVEYRPIDIFQEPKQKVTRDEAWRIVTEIIAGNAHSATECLMAAINGE